MVEGMYEDKPEDDKGDWGRLDPDGGGSGGDRGLSSDGVGRGVESKVLTLDLCNTGICEGVSGKTSKDSSFANVDALEGTAEPVGVGDTGAVRVDDAFSTVPRGGPSAGEGRFWITFNRSLLVRIAAV
jgi:hypothetical protein